MPGVHLGPVEAEDPVRGIDGEQETGGIEPRLGHPGVQIGAGHVALLGMVREGGPVRGEPGVLIPARDEGAQRHSVRQRDVGQFRRRAGEPHLPQLPDRAVAVARGEVGRGLVVAVGPGQQAGEAAGGFEFADQPVRHALVAVVGVDGNFQHARAVRFLDHDGDAGQILRRRRVGGLVGAVQGEGQRCMGACGPAGVRGPERHERLLGQRRIAIGFLGGGREGFDVHQELRIRGSLGGEDGPVLRVRGTHGARLYGAARAGPVLLFPGLLRIVVKSSGCRVQNLFWVPPGHEGDPPLGWPRYVRPVCPPLKKQEAPD